MTRRPAVAVPVTFLGRLEVPFTLETSLEVTP
jgi:hypothetical protein